ncbi:hypothetical protein, partial [Moraxella lacunata]|uniref:hypothetical protein n=1 Tax=Moraxella lacunata TaxID=477 RepID=UPI001C3F402D
IPSVCKHSYGVALYPPPEVGGFTATKDKLKTGLLTDCTLFAIILSKSIIVTNADSSRCWRFLLANDDKSR